MALPAEGSHGSHDRFFQLAADHERRGEYLLACDLAIKSVQLESPDRSRALLLAARACARLEDGHVESCSLAEQGLKEAAAEASALQIEAKHAYGSALLLRSRRALEGPWNLRERSSLLERAAQVLSSVSGDESAPVGVLFDHALVLAESGRHHEAILMASRALQSGGESLPSTWLLLSLLLSAQQRPADAIDMCRIGIKTVPFPANAELHKLLGELQKAQADFPGAVDTFKGLLQLVQRQEPELDEKNASAPSARTTVKAQMVLDFVCEAYSLPCRQGRPYFLFLPALVATSLMPERLLNISGG